MFLLVLSEDTGWGVGGITHTLTTTKEKRNSEESCIEHDKHTLKFI